MSIFEVMAWFALVLKMSMVERYIRVVDILGRQNNLVMDNVSLPLFALLAQASINLDPVLDKRLSAFLPRFTAIKRFREWLRHVVLRI